MINIVVLVLVIIILYIIFYVKREMYTDINEIIKGVYNSSGKKALTNILDSVDQSVNKFKDKNILSASKINLEDPLLDLYLDQKIISDVSNVNQGNTHGNKLPFIENDNYEKYNHQLRLLINSKKIKQDFIIGIIKNKINFLKGTLKNIKDIEEKYNKD